MLLRSDGEVDEDTLTYARTKIDAVVDRPGLPPVTGEVRITRAAAHHADRPWSATAALHVGGREVVVLAEEATARELAGQPLAGHRRSAQRRCDSVGRRSTSRTRHNTRTHHCLLAPPESTRVMGVAGHLRVGLPGASLLEYRCGDKGRQRRPPVRHHAPGLLPAAGTSRSLFTGYEG
ncbi:hypothetical protein [Streptomyces sp. D2-8]|uniref:hypothetical protein n=1 Tax=Streptomyces sp. D2-8 TaxID=2707767 RepID=UPI0020C0FF2C|nr:hypothetical protein [Streptomyces sp. D2-8]